MKILKVAFVALALIAGGPRVSLAGTVPAGKMAGEAAEKIEWFEGSFAELMAEARASDRLVFIDFWTEWCTWCKVLESETFADEAVAKAMKPLLAFRVDAESEEGKPIAKRFGVGGYPYLLFLEADGRQRDRVQNFQAPGVFLATLERVKRNEGTLTGLAAAVAQNGNDVVLRLDFASKLRDFGRVAEMREQLELVRGMLENELGFDPADLDLRYAIAEKLDALNLKKEARGQIGAIRRLDPEGKSRAMRRVMLSDLIQAGRKSRDPQALVEFLGTETIPEVLFEGWKFVGGIESSLAIRHRGEAVVHRARQREAWAQAWRYAPSGHRVLFGRKLAWELYERREEISEGERVLALEVAERVVAAVEGEDADLLDTLACCLFLNGRRDEAVKVLDRAVEIDPENVRWQLRRKEFSGG